MTVKQFIEKWIKKPACRSHGGWRSTPDRIGCTLSVKHRSWRPSERATEILAIRLPTGEVVSNSSYLSVARAEPMSYGSPREGAEAPAQAICVEQGSLPVPFEAMREAGVPLPADFEDPIPPDFRVADWKGPETVRIQHRHRKGEICNLCGSWQRRSSSREEDRHYTGAALIVQAEKKFIFDLDRGELCHGRWNPFVCLLKDRVEARTVEEAYDSLMPKVVRKAKEKGLDVKRQGEWFFIPDPDFMPPEVLQDLQEAVARRPHPLGYGIPEGDIIDYDGTLMRSARRSEATKQFRADLRDWERNAARLNRLLPTEITLQVQGSRGHAVTKGLDMGRGRIFVTGTVTAPDHDPLVLSDWRRVHANAAARSFRVTGAID